MQHTSRGHAGKLMQGAGKESMTRPRAQGSRGGMLWGSQTKGRVNQKQQDSGKL